MPSLKEGTRVRVVTRPVTDEDRKKNRYFEHMAGFTGTVQNVYGPDEIAVKIEPETLTPVCSDVHRVSLDRMRERFLSSQSEEAKKQLTPEELAFVAHYMILVREQDLEPLP